MDSEIQSYRISRFQKRINICEAIYSDLIWNSFDEAKKSKKHGNDSWTGFEWRIYKRYIKDKTLFLEQIDQLLRTDWSVHRLNLSILAIILEAFSEYSVFKTEPAILIQQSVLLAKDYGEDEYKLVHAVIDNYIKQLLIKEKEIKKNNN
ncbi:transcription antitermination factor NusB [Mycoplasma parvum]|uniref:NusB/RsmB/TIM44 domain-containing protein n=1 Tax=Mycoplasma parvum str. Indiana TaxID=1403316 RepID=U5NCR6_9MOLU|nr:transcription antitermination factor NusB [Mycoplasma parvum]AGX89222.1 hypothetical protein PRV_02425 [Mycoplasma parvum str. Indiana]